MDWNKMVKMTVPVGLCGWQQRGSLTINGRTTEFPVGVETELPEPVAERIKALIADAEEKAEHVKPLPPWMQHVTGADGVARWEPRLAYADVQNDYILKEMSVTVETSGANWYDVEWLAAVNVGDKGIISLDGVEYTYTVATGPYGHKEFKLDNGPGEPQLMIPPSPGSLRVTGTTLGATYTIAIYNKVTTIKTFDTDLMGKNAGANKALVTDENGEAVWSDSLPSGSGGGGGVIYINTEIVAPYTEIMAYADAACTTPLTYEQGKAIVGTGCALSHKAENGETLTFVPAFTHAFDANKQVVCFVSVPDESGMLVTTMVDVGFAGE